MKMSVIVTTNPVVRQADNHSLVYGIKKHWDGGAVCLNCECQQCKKQDKSNKPLGIQLSVSVKDVIIKKFPTQEFSCKCSTSSTTLYAYKKGLWLVK